MRELQTMARHSTPALTANIYARTRNERLSELTEKISENILSGKKCAKSVHCKHVESLAVEPKLLLGNKLQTITQNGGGGIRTPVPRCFKTGFYMLIRLNFLSPHQPLNDKQKNRLFRRNLALSARTTDLASLLFDALTSVAGKLRQNGPLLNQPFATVSCQLQFIAG